MNYVLAVMLLVASMACSNGTAQQHAQYDAYLSLMKGLSVDQLVNSWGAPDDTATSKNGNKVMIYLAQREAPISQRNFITGRQETVRKEYRCRTSFEVGQDSRVLMYEFEGNGCGSRKIRTQEQ